MTPAQIYQSVHFNAVMQCQLLGWLVACLLLMVLSSLKERKKALASQSVHEYTIAQILLRL
jgi:hypothetical protein